MFFFLCKSIWRASALSGVSYMRVSGVTQPVLCYVYKPVNMSLQGWNRQLWRVTGKCQIIEMCQDFKVSELFQICRSSDIFLFGGSSDTFRAWHNRILILSGYILVRTRLKLHYESFKFWHFQVSGNGFTYLESSSEATCVQFLVDFAAQLYPTSSSLLMSMSVLYKGVRMRINWSSFNCYCLPHTHGRTCISFMLPHEVDLVKKLLPALHTESVSYTHLTLPTIYSV